MDYNADGKLIVDPQVMMDDGFGDIGKMLGFIIARFVEKTWIKFEPLKNRIAGTIICVICLVPIPVMYAYLRSFLVSMLGTHWGRLTYSIFYAFYYIAFIPLLLKLLNRRHAREQKAA